MLQFKLANSVELACILAESLMISASMKYHSCWKTDN